MVTGVGSAHHRRLRIRSGGLLLRARNRGQPRGCRGRELGQQRPITFGRVRPARLSRAATEQRRARGHLRSRTRHPARALPRLPQEQPSPLSEARSSSTTGSPGRPPTNLVRSSFAWSRCTSSNRPSMSGSIRRFSTATKSTEPSQKDEFDGSIGPQALPTLASGGRL